MGSGWAVFDSQGNIWLKLSDTGVRILFFFSSSFSKFTLASNHVL
jgi:hypothetical protein